jgi:hypothetical protein
VINDINDKFFTLPQPSAEDATLYGFSKNRR